MTKDDYMKVIQIKNELNYLMSLVKDLEENSCPFQPDEPYIDGGIL